MKERNYTIFAVDFDGVLCRDEWPKIGPALEHNIEWIRALQSTGAKFILWTSRTGLRLDHAVEWCREHGLEFDAVNENLPEIIKEFGGDTRKIFADYYIDDRNLLMNAGTNERHYFDQFEIVKIEEPTANGCGFSKTVEERIADGEVDPEYFFEVPT